MDSEIEETVLSTLSTWQSMFDKPGDVEAEQVVTGSGGRPCEVVTRSQSWGISTGEYYTWRSSYGDCTGSVTLPRYLITVTVHTSTNSVTVDVKATNATSFAHPYSSENVTQDQLRAMGTLIRIAFDREDIPLHRVSLEHEHRSISGR